MPGSRFRFWLTRVLSGGGILVYFVIAFEFMVMISPFALFFYSVFNPVLLFLSRFGATRWLTGFFLPHMVYPPSLFLEGIRIVGSALFVLGAAMFLVCALQVYLGKLFRHAVATWGLYRVVRHPQYLGLAVCSAGLAILWPRLFTLASLALMLVLYYFLARDEERRMTRAHGDAYREFMARTGMFLPRWLEHPFVVLVPERGRRVFQTVAVPVVMVAVVLGAGFAFRALTVAELPRQTAGNLTVVSILPEDNGFLAVVAGTLAASEQHLSDSLTLDPRKHYLGYLMPVDYVMQGMIANTGDRSQLYKHHHTVAMIGDWILHPFRHLRETPAMCEHMPPGHTMAMARRHLCPLSLNDPSMDCSQCQYRRVVLVEVAAAGSRQLFSLNAARTPVGYLDMDVSARRVVDAKPVPSVTAWEAVPTPVF
jgi:protein-S-isoprenylcysteine O-methyltransferase Ste14